MKLLAAAAVVMVNLMAVSCTGTPPVRMPLLHTLTRPELIALINHNGQVVHTLRDTDASITIRSRNAEGELEERDAGAMVAYARGGKLRLDVTATGFGTVMVLCTDGRTMWIDNQWGDSEQQKGVFRDRVNKLNRIARTGGQIRPEDLVSAMALEPINLADPNTVVTFEQANDWDGTTAQPVYYLSVSENDGGQAFLTEKYLVDRTSLQLIGKRIYDRSGAIVMAIRYANFQTVDYDAAGETKVVLFPRTIEIAWPAFEQRIQIELDAVEVNIDLKPILFDYPKQQGLPDNYKFKPIVPE